MKVITISESKEGTISISDSAIIAIIEQQIIEIVGVGNQQNKNAILKFLDSLRTKMKVQVDEHGTLILDVPIKVVYGTNVKSIALNVQDRVFSAMKEYLYLEDVLVNIYVDGLVIPD